MVMDVGEIVRHLGPADLAQRHDVGPGPAVGADLENHQLPADVAVLFQRADLDDLHQLVELFFHLLHDAVAAFNDDGNAGNGGIVGDAHRQGVDVERPAGEQAGNPVEDAGLIFHQTEIVCFISRLLLSVGSPTSGSTSQIRMQLPWVARNRSSVSSSASSSRTTMLGMP